MMHVLFSIIFRLHTAVPKLSQNSYKNSQIKTSKKRQNIHPKIYPRNHPKNTLIKINSFHSRVFFTCRQLVQKWLNMDLPYHQEQKISYLSKLMFFIVAKALTKLISKNEVAIWRVKRIWGFTKIMLISIVSWNVLQITLLRWVNFHCFLHEFHDNFLPDSQ